MRPQLANPTQHMLSEHHPSWPRASCNSAMVVYCTLDMCLAMQLTSAMLPAARSLSVSSVLHTEVIVCCATWSISRTCHEFLLKKPPPLVTYPLRPHQCKYGTCCKFGVDEGKCEFYWVFESLLSLFLFSSHQQLAVSATWRIANEFLLTSEHLQHRSFSLFNASCKNPNKFLIKWRNAMKDLMQH